MAPQRQSLPFEKHCGKNMAGERAFPGGERGAPAGPRREPRPLDSAQLEALALSYVARFATSAAKLERYLARKLRERGWDGPEEPELAPLVARHIALGYVDDEAFARARSTSLLRRGYGPRRIGEALGAAGIAEAVRDVVRPAGWARRGAALAMARKRRFGPFGAEPLDPARRDKQIAAMLRAGHMLADARAMIDAPNLEAAEEWAAASED